MGHSVNYFTYYYILLLTVLLLIDQCEEYKLLTLACLRSTVKPFSNKGALAPGMHPEPLTACKGAIACMDMHTYSRYRTYIHKIIVTLYRTYIHSIFLLHRVIVTAMHAMDGAT
jgi:hypothetical protein